jgi:hypothetical protein
VASNDLMNRKVSSISVCGKMLRKGQVLTVASSAVGDRERKMEQRGRIKILSSNREGFLQVKAL